MNRIAPIIVLLLAASPVALATPANKAALERHFGPHLSKSLANCSTCHQPAKVKEPESLADIPHNPFGARLRAIGKELAKDNRPRDIPARLGAIADEDADSDGTPNLAELLLSHRPGDAEDRPTPAELESLNEKLAAYKTFLASYRFLPFEPVTRPAIPQVKNTTWVRNPIDAFLAAKHEELGLTPRPQAPKHILLRRLYLDVIGLVPTAAELDAFAADTSADAYEKIVDKLLADPRHGQRWARHWMDIWRYSDWAGWTDGNQIRDSQPHIWRWRDWIVDSLNSDKPYDRMLVEMLAGDEIAPTDPDTLRATGFLARNYKMLSREQWLEDTLNHTSRAFLGVTLHCAKCHDHMYDPISQQEYYQLRAIFEPHDVRVDQVPGQTDIKKDGLPRVFDKHVTTPTHFFIRGDERHPDKDRGAMTPAIPQALGGKLDIGPVKLPRDAFNPDAREFVRNDLLAESEKALRAAKKAWDDIKTDDKAPADKKSLLETAAALADAKHKALVASITAERLEETGKKESEDFATASRAATAAQRNARVFETLHALITARQAHIAAKDDKAREGASKKLAEAEAAHLKATVELNEDIHKQFKRRSTTTYPDTSTGRRLAFAKWLTDKKNPLTARVAVNHIFLRHFGRAPVPSPDDFGASGRPPTNPALLDYLAAEFMAHNWSMKHLHRLILTSAAYRMDSSSPSSSPSPGTPGEGRGVGSASIYSQLPTNNFSKDPDNLHLWRFPPHRLEAESVRDNLLHLADQLDASLNGPEIPFKQALTTQRRSLYIQTAPEKQAEFLMVFDAPSPTECYQRRPSIIPQQALALSNSPLAISSARTLAKSLAEKAGTDDTQFILAAFKHILSRTPTIEELDTCRRFLSPGAQPTTRPTTQPTRQRENLILVLFNHHEFLTIR